jgi:DNA transformation protein
MNDSGFVSHCLELLGPLGRTSSRRMFGGHALYIDGLCMALIIQDTLYLKVDDTSRPLLEREGCRPFTYDTKTGERHALGYYTAPEAAMESPAEMMPWARRALAAAVGARAKAPGKKKAAAKAPAKKPAPAKKAPAKAAAAKKTPAKAAAKKAAPAKKAAVTTAAGKAPARRAAARKATRA